MTAAFNGPIQNEPKPEIGIVHYNRKWNHFDMVICVQHCALQQRRQQNYQRQPMMIGDDDCF
jgi:hypothetical protein